MNRFVTVSIFIVTGIVGIAALIYPFLGAVLGSNMAESSIGGADRIADQPWLTGLILAMCVAVLLIDLQGKSADSKVVASLGVLVAMASVLRLLETAIPGPAGFSPIFVPIILAGYVFGPRYGFLMGAMTLWVSALITAGVGPWLPFQMIAAGWIGMSAGLLPHLSDAKRELALLAAFGLIWGILYGLLLNLFLWPFVTGGPESIIGSGDSLLTSIGRYAGFYVTTSLIWDLARGAGNALLLLAVGMPIVQIMGRFKDKITFQVV